MKRLIILPLLLLTMSLGATTYYVATTGSDGAAGSLAAPWATWQKGFSSLVAGDTLYIRGGTYQPTGTYLFNGYRGVGINNIDGASGNLIKVFNYPGEKPILDCVNITNVNNRGGVYLAYSDYWHLRGLEVKNVAQYANTGDPYYSSGGFGFVLSDHIIVENCVAHHIGGSGFYAIDQFTDISFINCDTYANADPYSSDAYGGADGFALNSSAAAGNILLRGCRAWYNSDDGIDLYAVQGLVTVDRCWTWRNGYEYNTTNHTGDGNGIKLGITADYSGTLKRIVTNCITFGNFNTGILQNMAQCIIHLYNNTSYGNNGHGIEIYSYSLVHVIKNNVSFGNTGNNYNDDGGTAIANAIISNNSYDADWQPTGPVATAADFESLSTVVLDQKRNTDGSLPKLRSFRLRAGSDLIDAGTNVGLTTDTYGHRVPQGLAPDIGATEYGNYVLFYNGKQLY